MAKKSKLTPLQMMEYNKKSKSGKFKSKGIYRDGYYFHSIWEADYYDGLKMRLLAGDFASFKRQVKIPIIINGIKITSYVADFVVTKFDGTRIIIDCKSEFTRNLETYKIKKQLLLALYNLVIKEELRK